MLRVLVFLVLSGFLSACAAEQTTNQANLGGKADDLVDAEGSLLLDGEEGDVESAPNLFELAYDVNLHHVVFPEDFDAPPYSYPSVSTGFSLGGTEFWQKFSGGQNPTFNYNEGTDYGRRCMYASSRRFEAIMSNPPEALKVLKANTNWNGSFFNWNDDYGQEDAWGDASSARLWAWRTTLVKWISQTSKDGSCYLPTLDMVQTLIVDCLDQAGVSFEVHSEADCVEAAGTPVDDNMCGEQAEEQVCCAMYNGDGEIQGCRAP